MNSFEKKKGKDFCNEKPRKPSAKVKNPCKICSETVNIKTGLQCKGACKKWAHFDCLKLSPRQVEDVQCGLIKINCPCPDCDNDSKVTQSRHDKNREHQFQPYGRYNDCNKTFCAGIPQQKSSQRLSNFDSLNKTSKPLPYRVSEGTSYHYTVENQTKNVFTIKRIEDEQNDDDNVEQEDENEEKSDVEEIERKCQTILLAPSSSHLTAAICGDSSRMSPNNKGVTIGEPPKSEKGESSSTSSSSTSSSSTSSSSTSSDETTKKLKKKKGKERKPKKKKKDKKDKKDKKNKKDRKNKKEKKEKKRKGKIKKGDSSCRCPCCNSVKAFKGSKESGESSASETSESSSETSESTKSTQAPCGHTKLGCPRKGVSSPKKLVNNNRQPLRELRAPRPGPHTPPLSQYIDGTYVNCPPTNPNCPPLPSSTLQQLKKQYQLPPPHGTLRTTYPPTYQNIKPKSICPPACPLRVGQGQTRTEHMAKSLGKCAACLPGCCNPYRSRTAVLYSTSSTQVLRLSPLNKFKSCCTLDRPNKKEGTSNSTDIRAHLVKCSKSDTKTWDQQEIDEYNRKMLLLALEQMCQTMGQFSVQCRELVNKMTDEMDTSRREEFT